MKSLTDSAVVAMYPAALLLALVGGVGCATETTPAQLLDEELSFTEAYFELAADGMEPSSAGFHLLRPREDPTWSGLHAVSTSGGWSWWPGVAAKYEVPYSLDEVAESHVQASFQRPFLNGVASYAMVAQPDGLFRVEAALTPDGLAILRALVGDVGSDVGPYVDWFGLQKGHGEIATDMRAVLVSDNLAYQPFSVRDIVLGLAPPLVVVATDLDSLEASQLIGLLQ